MTITVTIPTLTTARLTLRRMLPDDFPAYAAFMASPRSAGMGGPFNEKAAWGMFCHDAAGWALFGYGALMVEAEGRAVGQVGISHGPLFPESELGWFLYAGYEGQGYASEAAAALRDWSFDQGLATLVSYTGPDNYASQAVARRLGAVIDPAAPVQDAGDIVWRHPRGAR